MVQAVEFLDAHSVDLLAETIADNLVSAGSAMQASFISLGRWPQHLITVEGPRTELVRSYLRTSLDMAESALACGRLGGQLHAWFDLLTISLRQVLGVHSALADRVVKESPGPYTGTVFHDVLAVNRDIFAALELVNQIRGKLAE